jgi:hypothetical protein
MNRADAMRISPRLIVGLAIAALGVLWTLDNLDVLQSEPITRFWPVVLIVIGISQLSTGSKGGFAPLVLIAIGGVLLLNRLDVWDVDLRDLIPLAIVILGVKLIRDAFGRKVSASNTDSSDTVHAFAMMAGVRHQSTSRQFRGGDVDAVMGGVELDLRESEIAAGQEVVLDAFALMGGVDIFIPAHWKVESSVTPFMGAYEDNTKHNGQAGPVLKIRGTAVWGAIEVKN